MNHLHLSSEEKVLVHILPFQRYADDMVVPFEITQKGVADAVGVKLTQVSRLLSSLVSRGLVEFKKAHVQGIQKKVKVYFPTKEGVLKAEEIISRIEKLDFPVVVSGQEEQRTYSEIREMTGASILQILDMLESEGALDLSSLKPSSVGTFLVQHPPIIDSFVGRENEIKEISDLISGSSKAVVIYGNAGYGKSSLLFRVMKDFRNDINMLWVVLNRRTGVDEITRPLSSFLTSLDKMGLEPLIFSGASREEIVSAAISRLDGTHSILVFDGYGEVKEELVEFFIALLRAVSSARDVKLVFTAQEDTPYYCRFYGPKDVEDGTVREYHLSGLSYEDTGVFLGMEDGEQLRRIHRMTSGNPSLLRLIKEGDRDALRDTGLFSTEEINMLLYLAAGGS